METQDTASGASDSKTGGQEGDAPESKEQAQLVPWENHKKALDDMHKYKKTVREYEAKFGQIESDRLKEKEDFKSLAELNEQKALAAEQKLTKFQEGYFTSAKYDAVKMAAAKAGIRPEAEVDLELLALEGVEVEVTTNGRTLVHNADKFVEGLQKTRPYWFKSKDVSKINSGGANGFDDGKITPEMLNSLEKKDPVKYKAMFAKYMAQRNK